MEPAFVHIKNGEDTHYIIHEIESVEKDVSDAQNRRKMREEQENALTNKDGGKE